jgi:glycosyltransferase involved in cell wall biosynthesis
VNTGLVTAIIPAYNEAGRIAETVRAASQYTDEVLVVDDASTDTTKLEAEQAGARVLRQPYNQGYISAIRRGYTEAKGEIVITLDGDGEFSADCIPELITPLLEGTADMVQGHRNIVPRFSERLLTGLARLRAPVGDSGTGLRALRTNLARQLELRGRCICGTFSLEVAYHGGRISEIPIRLTTIQKPRRIAWFHIVQFFYLLPWLFKHYDSRSKR